MLAYSDSIPSPFGDFANVENLGMVLKAIYKHKRQDQFISTLGKFIETNKSEIQDICNYHYQEFVQSVDQILQVRKESESVQQKIVELGSTLQSSGKVLMAKVRERL